VSIEAEFARAYEEPHGFSPRIHAAYNQAISSLEKDPRLAGFNQDDSKPDLDDDSLYGGAKHFYWYFQTHHSKAQYALLRLSNEAIRRDHDSWLNDPRLSIIDIGCGTGAATFAILDLLCDYNEYCWNNKHPTWHREVQLVAMEPSAHAIAIMRRLLEALEPELSFNSISVTLTIINEPFPSPDCIKQLKMTWSPVNPISCLTISSNVIRPIQNMWDRAVALLTQGGIRLDDADLGKAVAKAYEDILGHYGFQRIAFLDIATWGKSRRGETFFRILDQLWSTIRTLFGGRPIYSWWNDESEPTINFRNDPGTRNGDHPVHELARSTFTLKIHAGMRFESLKDGVIADTLAQENLELAWARARNYALSDDFVDEVEIKLADVDHAARLARLRYHLNAEDWQHLGIGFRIPFPLPKNESGDRPRTLLHLGEQVAAASISQAQLKAFSPIDSNHILGNRPNRNRDEFFFESWFMQWKSYWNAIHLAAKDGLIVCKLDVKSYYTQITQRRLLQDLLAGMGIPSTSQARKLLSVQILERLAAPHATGLGLPQIGVASALWATRFLTAIDSTILKTKPDSVDYYRYADDITLIAPLELLEAQINAVQQSMASLGLTLNAEKTKKYPAIAYRQALPSFSQHNGLAKQFRELLEALYY